MENKSKPAKFQFKGFRIEKSLINILEPNPEGNFDIKFTPKGEISKSKSTFILKLEIYITNKTKTIEVDVLAIADFYFEDIEDEKKEAYFFLNGPALLFPYIRAYISTLSTLSGIKSIILPTLNLVGLRSGLKKNTIVID